jgi:hypothetical protein
LFRREREGVCVCVRVRVRVRVYLVLCVRVRTLGKCVCRPIRAAIASQNRHRGQQHPHVAHNTHKINASIKETAARLPRPCRKSSTHCVGTLPRSATMLRVIPCSYASTTAPSESVIWRVLNPRRGAGGSAGAGRGGLAGRRVGALLRTGTRGVGAAAAVRKAGAAAGGKSRGAGTGLRSSPSARRRRGRRRARRPRRPRPRCRAAPSGRTRARPGRPPAARPRRPAAPARSSLRSGGHRRRLCCGNAVACAPRRRTAAAVERPRLAAPAPGTVTSGALVSNALVAAQNQISRSARDLVGFNLSALGMV